MKKRWYGAKKRMVGDKFEYLEVVENLKVERIDMSTGWRVVYLRYPHETNTQVPMSSKVKWFPLEYIERKIVLLMQIL